jgi:hypothetical protein
VRSQRGSFGENVPTLKQFDRVLVAVPEEEAYRFLDPFLDDVELGYLRWGRGNTALVVKDDGSAELVEIPKFDPEENLVYNTVSAALTEEGWAKVSVSTLAKGYFDRKVRRRLKDATPSETQKVFDATSHAFSPGSTELTNNVSDLKRLNRPARAGQALECPDFALKQGEFLIVRVPEFPFPFSRLDAYPSLSDRKLPFDLPCEAHLTYDCKIIVPQTLEPARLPEPVTVETPEADFRLTCRQSPEDGNIYWMQDIVFKEKTISLESYAGFKEAYDSITSPKSSLILLRERAPGIGRARK